MRTKFEGLAPLDIAEYLNDATREMKIIHRASHANKMSALDFIKV